MVTLRAIVAVMGYLAWRLFAAVGVLLALGIVLGLVEKV